MRFSFGDFVLDTDRFLLERSGESLHVQPQVLEVLGYLVSHRERVVPKTELLDNVWGDRFVSESTLSSRIKAARRIVGDDGVGQTVIKTIHGRGYRWVAQGQASEDESARPLLAEPGRLEQQIRFCTAQDGTRIAYATVGSGPPLVRAAHWVTHLDYEWDSPIWQHWMRDLSRNRTLVRYDERGCGLSDQDPSDISLESFVADLEAVVDELALPRFPLMGVSQGGPVAIEYAHRHPDRVSRLVLLGAFVRGRPRLARRSRGGQGTRSTDAHPARSRGYGSAARTAARRSPTSSGSARNAPMNASSRSRPTTRWCWSVRTTVPRPWSTSCTRWPAALPPASRTSPRPVASP